MRAMTRRGFPQQTTIQFRIAPGLRYDDLQRFERHGRRGPMGDKLHDQARERGMGAKLGFHPPCKLRQSSCSEKSPVAQVWCNCLRSPSVPLCSAYWMPSPFSGLMRPAGWRSQDDPVHDDEGTRVVCDQRPTYDLAAKLGVFQSRRQGAGLLCISRCRGRRGRFLERWQRFQRHAQPHVGFAATGGNSQYYKGKHSRLRIDIKAILQDPQRSQNRRELPESCRVSRPGSRDRHRRSPSPFSQPLAERGSQTRQPGPGSLSSTPARRAKNQREEIRR